MKYHDFRIGKTKFTLWLDTKKHIWKVYFGDPFGNRDPDMTFTRAKGNAVFEFVKEFEKQHIQAIKE